MKRIACDSRKSHHDLTAIAICKRAMHSLHARECYWKKAPATSWNCSPCEPTACLAQAGHWHSVQIRSCRGALKHARAHPKGHGYSHHTVSSFWCVCIYMCVLERGGQRTNLCVIPYMWSTLLLVLFLGLGSLIKLGWLASKLQGPAYYCLLIATVTCPCHMPGLFSYGFQDSGS